MDYIHLFIFLNIIYTRQKLITKSDSQKREARMGERETFPNS